MAEHNFQQQGPQTLYNSRGEYMTVYNKDAVNDAKQLGFTSARYVKSLWPTTVWNKKTGADKSVGDIKKSQAENEAAVTALGDEWTTEPVAAKEPEPVRQLSSIGGMDSGLVLALMNDLKIMQQRVQDTEDAIIELSGARTALDARVRELEALLSEATAPAGV